MNLRFGYKSAFIAILVVVTAISSAFAQTEEHPLIIKARKQYAPNKGIHMTFDLSIYWAVREVTQEKKGVLFVSPGDKFRAEVGQTIWVSDGHTYWQYSKAANQVIIKDLLDVDLSMHPSQMLQNYLNKGTFTFVGEDNNLSRFSWKAQNGSSTESLDLWINNKKATIEKIKVVDRSGNVSTYTFKKSRFDIDIPEKTFSLTIPEGANVLDTRE